MNGFVPQVGSQLPVHPDVKLKSLPFYDHVAVLLGPATLGTLIHFNGSAVVLHVLVYRILVFFSSTYGSGTYLAKEKSYHRRVN